MSKIVEPAPDRIRFVTIASSAQNRASTLLRFLPRFLPVSDRPGWVGIIDDRSGVEANFAYSLFQLEEVVVSIASGCSVQFGEEEFPSWQRKGDQLSREVASASCYDNELLAMVNVGERRTRRVLGNWDLRNEFS